MASISVQSPFKKNSSETLLLPLMLKHSLLLLLLVLSIATTNAQDFDPPEEYQLVKKEDYAPYEKDVIAAAKWLQETPVKTDRYKRKIVSKFVFEWVNGSPSVFCGIAPIIFDFEKKNEGLLILYMSAVARYVLENNYSTDVKSKYLFAIHTLIDFYTRNEKNMKKDKKMARLLDAKANGTLNLWMEENMKMDK